MVNGFDALSGILNGSVGNVAGSYTIAAILIVILCVILLAWMGVDFVMNLAITGSLAIGLAFVGWFPQGYGSGAISTVSIVMVLVAMVTTPLFIRWLQG